jgi:hypothetical protein
MAAWPYRWKEFRFTGHVGDDSPVKIFSIACLLFFVGCGVYILTINVFGGLLILVPSAFVAGSVLVTGAREGVVDEVVCTAESLNVTRRFLFRRKEQTDIYRWSAITNVRVVVHRVGSDGHKLAYLEVDTLQQSKVLEMRTTLNEFDVLLDVIGVMTPQLPYRWEPSFPGGYEPSTSYKQVERPRSTGQIDRAA